MPLAAIKKINDSHSKPKERLRQPTNNNVNGAYAAEMDSAQRRLERKLRRRERAAIGKPKLPTPLRPSNKSKRKIKASSIDGSKEESEGSHVSDSRKKKGNKYRAVPEVVKSYKAKNVQAPGGRITLVSEKFLTPSPTAQPFSEDQFLGSHGVSLDPMMGNDQEIWNQWRIRAPQPGPSPRSHSRGKQPQQQSEASWQLGPSHFQRSPIRASSFTSIMPSNHRHDAASAAQFSNSRLPPPGHTNSPSWHTETTDRPSYEKQQPPSLDKEITDIQSKDKVTPDKVIITIQSHPKLDLTSTVESEPAQFERSISNTWPIVQGSNDLAYAAGAPWKERPPSFGRPNYTEDLSLGETSVHSGDNGQAIGYFQRSQNNLPPASWSNGIAPDIERFHNPPHFQCSFTPVFQSMGDFMQILLSKCDSAYHSNQANITPLHELQPQAMSFYDPSEPTYQEMIADDPRLLLAPFDGAFDSIEPQQHFRCLGSSTNIRSNRPQLVPPTVKDAFDLYRDPLNPVNDQRLSLDQFDQSHFAEQGMWQERPSGRVEEQVGMTEEDWHRLWGQRAYHR
ncbi:hypothetical protein I307_05171 [Cryptococcus deuterogattii 99/473]|uniref:Uncharacterized protein n=1 Tax=Cryptococcus deuterogattii Ram5 TaxID=1296110 RepID=A0A0D0V142_9TREE|nr:hypothetical protein I313_03104 [Cryptococcus deuterogattii Ram5]KIY55420.1 hypothetical protein I307_05171 [Cryptococcus deuterogattii 99/473]